MGFKQLEMTIKPKSGNNLITNYRVKTHPLLLPNYFWRMFSSAQRNCICANNC